MYFYLDLLQLRKLGLVLWLHSQAGTSIPRHDPGPFSGLSVLVAAPPPLLLSWCLLQGGHLSTANKTDAVFILHFLHKVEQEANHLSGCSSLLVHPFAPWQYLCQQAELGWVMQGHCCHTVRAPATSISLHWVAQSYFFNSISIYLK